ncbi:MAG: CoA transferase, partial [Chloroflexota bacterium]
TREARLENKKEFDRLVQEKLMDSPAEDWLELMHVEDIPAAPVNSLDKVLADPQVEQRHMVLELEHALGGKVKLVGNPLKMPGSIDDTFYDAPPVLGQHNEEVLGGLLGYSRAKIDLLLEEGRANIEALREHLQKRL